ncbi:ribosomal protein L27e, partial [Sistotremastrum suecicum HHB10207 ss-3]
ENHRHQVKKRMGAKRLAARNKVKPFMRAINYSHLFPKRYTLEFEGLKGLVGSETIMERSQRNDAKKTVKKLLEEWSNAG